MINFNSSVELIRMVDYSSMRSNEYLAKKNYNGIMPVASINTSYVWVGSFAYTGSGFNSGSGIFGITNLSLISNSSSKTIFEFHFDSSFFEYSSFYLGADIDVTTTGVFYDGFLSPVVYVYGFSIPKYRITIHKTGGSSFLGSGTVNITIRPDLSTYKRS